MHFYCKCYLFWCRKSWKMGRKNILSHKLCSTYLSFINFGNRLQRWQKLILTAIEMANGIFLKQSTQILVILCKCRQSVNISFGWIISTILFMNLKKLTLNWRYTSKKQVWARAIVWQLSVKCTLQKKLEFPPAV